MKKAFAWAALAGLAIGGSAPPNGLVLCSFVAVFALMAAMDALPKNATYKSVFATGLFAGTIANACVLSWSVGMLEDFGHFPLIPAFLVSILLWASQGLFIGFGLLFAEGLRRSQVRTSIALTIALTMATVLSPAIFPWHISTAIFPILPFVQLAEFGGAALVDLWLFATVAFAYDALRERNIQKLVAATALIVFNFAFGSMRIRQVNDEVVRHVAVGVVQPNIGILDKHNPDKWPANLDRLRKMSVEIEKKGADVIVWPETAYPYPLARERLYEPMEPYAIHSAQLSVPVLIGSITIDRADGFYNSAVSVSRDGKILGIADKVQLLAFGEYIPLWEWLPPLHQFFPSSGITPGKAPQTLDVGQLRVGVLNCYEDVLDGYAREVIRGNPDVLVNLTNDAWFGQTAEPHLHNIVARFRAIETRRDLVRAVNTGVSTHIDATGAMPKETHTFERAEFIADVKVHHTMTLWSRLGDLVTPILLGVWFSLLVRGRYLRRVNPSS